MQMILLEVSDIIQRGEFLKDFTFFTIIFDLSKAIELERKILQPQLSKRFSKWKPLRSVIHLIDRTLWWNCSTKVRFPIETKLRATLTPIFLVSKIKRHLLLKKSSYGRGSTIIRNKQQVFLRVLVAQLRFIEGRKQSHEWDMMNIKNDCLCWRLLMMSRSPKTHVKICALAFSEMWIQVIVWAVFERYTNWFKE